MIESITIELFNMWQLIIFLSGWIFAGAIAWFVAPDVHEMKVKHQQIKDMHERIADLSVSVGVAYRSQKLAVETSKDYLKFIVSKGQRGELLDYLTGKEQAADAAPWFESDEDIKLDPAIIAKIEEVLARVKAKKPEVIEAEVVLVTPPPTPSVPLIEAQPDLPVPARSSA